MQHRLLLGSTALVSAGILFAGASPAKADIEVVLGGYTEFGVKAANEDTNAAGPDRNYNFYMDNEVFISANGATEGGILYGSHMELEVGSGDGTSSDAFADEVGLFFSGNFGRFEFGQEDGAEDVMGIGGEDTQAGTGGIDGDTTNLTTFEVTDTADSTKASYFTPRVAGFQLGATWTPDDGDGVEDTDLDGVDQENIASAGINWVGALGPADLTVAATGIMGSAEGGGDEDLESWEAGALVGFGGLSLGAKVGQETDLNEGDFLNAGIGYGFGAANVSVGYVYFDSDEEGDTNLFAVSGDLGLMPGVTLKGDVTYNTEDPQADESNGGDTDETVAGVVSLQLDY